MKKLLSLVLVLALALSLAACGGGQPAAAGEKSQDLQAVYDSCSAALAQEMMLLDADTMETFLGIDPAKCTQAVTAIGADGMSAEEIWLLEAKDEKALEELQALAESRIADKLEEAENYIPENVRFIENGVVRTNGLYLVMIVSANVDMLLTQAEPVLN